MAGGPDARGTVNAHISSYGLKHAAEPDIGYVTNGQFIATAVHCGFQYKLIPNSPSVVFNIAPRHAGPAYKPRPEQ